MMVSVVIPTRDRRDRLLATLDALDAQRLSAGVEAEVVVCDNGSRDGTAIAVASRRRGALPVTLVSRAEGGASHARNAALEVACGDVALLLGDDMVPARDDLLDAHARLHGERPEDGYAVLGRIAWARPTDFMRWTERAGLQFSFDDLQPGPVDPARYLYSSHASLKLAVLRDAGFDERFPFLGEDIELGIRLSRQGLILDYRPDLLVHHHHQQDVEGFAGRMEAIGAASRRLCEVHPRDAPAELTRPNAKWALYPFAAPVGRALLRAGARGRTRDRAWTAIVMRAYARGWRGHG
jgi:glycosyltransferase involved in cell wall biosynthesis